MLMDKLKGHSYDLSPFQYIEIMHHSDPEMQWILHSVVDEFLALPSNRPSYYVSDLFKRVAEEASKVLAERLNLDENDVNAERTARITFKAYRTFNEPRPKGAHNIVDIFMIYILDDVLRQMRYPNA